VRTSVDQNSQTGGRGRQTLDAERQTISEKCIECKLCRRECAFLRKYGNPKKIADGYNAAIPQHHEIPFACSLCRLCAAVCPVRIDPAAMFLEMRRQAVDMGHGFFPAHAALKRFEKTGSSRLFSLYALPASCGTVFFPGCALASTRPDKTMKLFELLRQAEPSIGMVLDCCTKPSHDLGRESYFHAMFNEMRDYLLARGIKRVIVACPS